MDTIFLYTYHWGHTTVDIITMSDSDCYQVHFQQEKEVVKGEKM